MGQNFCHHFLGVWSKTFCVWKFMFGKKVGSENRLGSEIHFGSKFFFGLGKKFLGEKMSQHWFGHLGFCQLGLSHLEFRPSWIWPSWILAILDLGILENPTLCFTFQFQANLTILRKSKMAAKKPRWSSEILNVYQIYIRHDLEMFYEKFDPNRVRTGWDISSRHCSPKLGLNLAGFAAGARLQSNWQIVDWTSLGWAVPS